MSDITAAQGRPAYGWSFVAVALAIAAATAWVLAGLVDDGLYTVTGALGIVAFGMGLKARREAKRTGARQWPALSATIVGGLLGALVIVSTVVWGLSHVV